MLSLRERLQETDRFLYGVELISTRGSMAHSKAIEARAFAADLAASDRIDWVSITDNAGGNPMLAPPALGRPILYAGKEVVIHLSCKDLNRNGLESEAWHLASEGFHNILALSGDYPVSGSEGQAKPVFDIDSIGLLTLLNRMNDGFEVESERVSNPRKLDRTSFFTGAVTSNFKIHENEVMPQYLKLEKKIECGAEFIINQIGYDSRKTHELIVYRNRKGLARIPFIGNVFVLNPRVAALFHSGKIPGVVVSEELLAISRKQADSPDRGKRFFAELAAKQVAICRGLGYRGVYLGGVHSYRQIAAILEMADGFARDDWKQFAKDIRFSRPGEFFLHAEDPETGLSDPQRFSSEYQDSLAKRRPAHPVAFTYRLSKWVHHRVFDPGQSMAGWGARICANSKDTFQGPAWMRLTEKAGKAVLFGCKDCGDCSLPDIAFLCPESSCAKNQRNGPCGGTREGICEVEDYECIWSRAYDRLKAEGREAELLQHAPVIQDHGLRGTSSWANTWLGRDHHARRGSPLQDPQDAAPETPPVPLEPTRKETS